MTSLSLVQTPVFYFRRQIQYLTILSNICLSIIFVSPKICGLHCITKSKLLHQSFGVLWYRGQVGTGGKGHCPLGSQCAFVCCP